MKVNLLDVNGKKIKEITTTLFEEPIREDIIFKVVEAEKIIQPYATAYLAGMNRSASGNIPRRRHVWKSDRGKGMSRLPKKIFWRRGTQFSCEATIIPSAKGGRRAHPPKGHVNLKKINKKEMKKALLSALSYSNSIEYLKEKYSTLKEKKIDMTLPIVVEDKIFELKSKERLDSMKKVLGDFYPVSIQKTNVRPGIGKMRGRKNKKNAGLLFVTGKNEKMKMTGIDIIQSDRLIVSDIANNGARITIFSENAIKELENLTKNKDKIKKKEEKTKTNEKENVKEKPMEIKR